MDIPAPAENNQLPEHPYRRKTWVTVLLHLISPALPFVYNGRFRTGIILAILLEAFWVLLLIVGAISFTWLILMLVFGLALWIAFLIYSIKSTQHTNKLKLPRTPRLLARAFFLLVVIIIMGQLADIVFKPFTVETYKIPASSMEKTILRGDYLMVRKNIDPDKIIPGDIIVFKYPGDRRQNFLKRVVAIAGQSVKIVDKQVFIDGKPEIEPSGIEHTDKNSTIPYVESGQWIRTDNGEVWYTEYRRDNMPEAIVPEGNLFVLGDSRDNSSDSRLWGFLDKKLVLGKARYIHFSWRPYDPHDPDVHFPEPPEVTWNPITWIKSLAFNIYYFPQRVRWERLGMETK